MDRLTAKLVNRLTAMFVNRLTAMLVNRLTAKLMNRLTPKLVVVNLVKLHLTKLDNLSEYTVSPSKIIPSKMVFEKYKPRGLFSEFYGKLKVFRRTQSESDISITTKGFGISILPTRACRNRRLLGLLQGLWELGDKGPVGITIYVIRACRNPALHTAW